MKKLFAIWKLDLEREKKFFLLWGIFALAGALPAFGNFFPQNVNFTIKGCYLIALTVFGLVVSLDLFARDFTHGTFEQLLSLPIGRRQLFFAKYLLSAVIFLFPPLCSILLLAGEFSIENGPRSPLYILTQSGAAAWAAWIAAGLFLHAVFVFSVLAARGAGGGIAGVFLLFAAAGVILPSAVWIPNDYIGGYAPKLACFFGFWTLALIAGNTLLYCRTAALGRKLWLDALKTGGVLLLVSLSLFFLFRGMEIVSYLKTLNELEATPQIEIPSRVEVSRFVQEFDGKIVPPQLAAADLEEKTVIPVSDYPLYREKLERIVRGLRKRLSKAEKDGNWGTACSAMDALSALDTGKFVPLLCVFRQIPPRAGRGPVLYIHDDNMFLMFSLFPCFCGNHSHRKIHFSKKGSVTEFPKEFLERLERPFPVKRYSFRLLPNGFSCLYGESLRESLPGLGEKGWKRIVSVLAWYFKAERFRKERFLVEFLSGGVLKGATNTMRGLLIAAPVLEKTESLPLEDRLIRRKTEDFWKGRADEWGNAGTKTFRDSSFPVFYYLNEAPLLMEIYRKYLYQPFVKLEREKAAGKLPPGHSQIAGYESPAGTLSTRFRLPRTGKERKGEIFLILQSSGKEKNTRWIGLIPVDLPEKEEVKK